jgi:hypothetical protein
MASEGAREHVTKLASVQGSQNADDGVSGVYIVERVESEACEPRRTRGRVHEKAKKAMNPLLEQVTLVVYGWKSVEPGTLSWVFPSVSAAVAAARAMKNAVKWAIVAGRRETDEAADAEGSDGDDDSARQDDALDEARASGAVLIEQAG